MVRIDVTAEGPLILAVPNNGVEAARYGALYTAPQRLNVFTWFEGQGFREGRLRLWLKMNIDEHGKVLEYQVTDASNASQVMIEGIKKDVQRMAFLPGYFDGKPVPMSYVEPLLE